MTSDVILRAQRYRDEGYDFLHALSLAVFEARIDQWPTGWGDDLVALIFGDFECPDDDLVFDQLGITIERERVEGTIIRSAQTVLKARVAVNEKSVPAVKDAARRLNTLTGALSYTNQGAPIAWWCGIIEGSVTGVNRFKLGERQPDGLLAFLQLLPGDAKRKVTAALFWTRDPKRMMLEHGRADELAVYSGYWNAFECLVSAA